VHRRPKLLVQEDEVLIGLDHQHIAEHAGWDVVHATVPSDALKAIRTNTIDGAFLDIQLLRTFTSYTVAEELERRRIPFVFVTGLQPEFIIDRFRDVPVIRKPAFRTHLLEALQLFRDTRRSP